LPLVVIVTIVQIVVISANSSNNGFSLLTMKINDCVIHGCKLFEMLLFQERYLVWVFWVM